MIITIKTMKPPRLIQNNYWFNHKQKEPPRGVFKKGVLKICGKCILEHPCRSVTLTSMSSCKFAAFFMKTFFKNNSGWLFLHN